MNEFQIVEQGLVALFGEPEDNFIEEGVFGVGVVFLAG